LFLAKIFERLVLLLKKNRLKRIAMQHPAAEIIY